MLPDGGGTIRDTRLMARALEQRWPISPAARKAIVARLLHVITNPDSKPREVIAASRGLLAAESQNQLDEHKIVDVSISARNDRLDAIAADLGIDQGLIESIARETSGGNSGDAGRSTSE
jgi:hypothetical protein